MENINQCKKTNAWSTTDITMAVFGCIRQLSTILSIFINFHPLLSISIWPNPILGPPPTHWKQSCVRKCSLTKPGTLEMLKRCGHFCEECFLSWNTITAILKRRLQKENVSNTIQIQPTIMLIHGRILSANNVLRLHLKFLTILGFSLILYCTWTK